jgi:hypothetical protein
MPEKAKLRIKINLNGDRFLKNFIFALLLSTAASFAGISTYYNYYENLNYDSPTALSSTLGAGLFDFLPVDLDDLDPKIKFSLSVSPNARQAGKDYGKLVKNAENIDVVKNFTFIYNQKREFMPFVSYYTPYKSVMTQNEHREIIKKRDAVSLGIISDLRHHQVGLSVDMLMSSYIDSDNTNGGEYLFRRGGFSAKMGVNVKVNKRSSMFLAASSPVFLDFDIDDNYDGNDRSYFDRFQASSGFNYKYGNIYAVYSAVYKNFEKFYEDAIEAGNSGVQLTYPWIIEHNFVMGYNIDKNLKISVDYQLLPSVFTKYVPDIGGEYRHTIGAFAGADFENFSLNFRYADSSIFSIDPFARTFFQFDIIYRHK